MSGDAAETPRRPLIILVALAAIVLVAGGLVALMKSPAPASSAADRRTPISVTSTVVGAPAPPAASDKLAIQTVVQNTHEFSTEQFAATGSQVLPAAPAIGNVIFINHSASAFQLPAGTRVTSDSGQVYSTDQAVQVGPQGTCQVRDTCHPVPITASAPGAAGNVAVHAITGLTGFSPAQVTVDNLLPVTAGRDAGPVAVVTPQDRDNALAKARVDLESTLRQRADDHLRQQPSGRTPLPETETVTVTATADHAGGDLAPTITVYVDVLASITTISMADLHSVLEAALARTAPAHAHLLGPIDVTYLVQQPTPDGRVVLITTAKGFTVAASSV